MLVPIPAQTKKWGGTTVIGSSAIVLYCLLVICHCQSLLS